MTDDKQARKDRPIYSGVMAYFPDAIAEVARVSCIGGKQHNKDGILRWDRSKSPDHADCLMRHMLERGTLDTDGLPHSAKVAWRALAMLQVELEKEKEPPAYKSGCFEPSVGHVEQPTLNGFPMEYVDKLPMEPAVITDLRRTNQARLEDFGCPRAVAFQIAKGITYTTKEAGRGFIKGTSDRYCYVAGPMRGLPQFNFPAFDKARDELVKEGFNVISPADIDRAASSGYDADQATNAFRDFHALHFLKKIDKGDNMLGLLPGWEKSTGAMAEYGLAKWLGLNIREV